MKRMRGDLNGDHHGRQRRENSGSEQIAGVECEEHRDRIACGFAQRGGAGTFVIFLRISVAMYHSE